jgi:hypothetical protein
MPTFTVTLQQRCDRLTTLEIDADNANEVAVGDDTLSYKVIDVNDDAEFDCNAATFDCNAVISVSISAILPRAAPIGL